MLESLLSDFYFLQIDWGGMDDGDGGIDFCDDIVDESGGEIDWGGGDEGGDEEIVITVEDAGQENPEGGVASGNEALSVLENTATRNVFIDELMEVGSW